MTVLAWDGKTLAADSRVSSRSDIITDNAQKIYKINNIGYAGDTLLAIAMSGALADFDKVVSFIHSSEFPGGEIDHRLNGIVVGVNYVYMLEQGTGYLVRYDRKLKVAEGSGEAYARSAMSLGMNAKDAIKHAIKHNSGCGGKIRCIEL